MSGPQLGSHVVLTVILLFIPETHPHSLQICGDYLLSKMDSQNAISFRNFASSMGDARLLAKVDAFIQDHLLEVSEQEDFLKLPRLKVSLNISGCNVE